MAGTVLGCMASRREDCEPLAGKSTLNRLELSAAGFNGKKARKIVADFDRMDDLLVEPLVTGYEEARQQIVLNIDTTDFEHTVTRRTGSFMGTTMNIATCR